MLIFYYKAHLDYKEWKTNRDYLLTESPEIKDWMTINIISRRFNINESEIYTTLNLTNKRLNKQITIKQICRYQKLDCEQVIRNLNEARQ